MSDDSIFILSVCYLIDKDFVSIINMAISKVYFVIGIFFVVMAAFSIIRYLVNVVSNSNCFKTNIVYFRDSNFCVLSIEAVFMTCVVIIINFKRP